VIGPRSRASAPSTLLGIGAAIVVAMAAAYYLLATQSGLDEFARRFILAIVAIVGIPYALILLAVLTGRIAAACLMTFTSATAYLLGVGWLTLFLFILSWEKNLIDVLPFVAAIVQLAMLVAAIVASRRIPAAERAVPFAPLVLSLPLIVAGILIAYAYHAFAAMEAAPGLRAEHDARMGTDFVRLTECVGAETGRAGAPADLRSLDGKCAALIASIEEQANYQVHYTRLPPDSDGQYDRFTLCLQPKQVPDSGLTTFVSNERGIVGTAQASHPTLVPLACNEAIRATPAGLAKRFEYCVGQYWAGVGRREYPATLDPIREALPGCLDGTTGPSNPRNSRRIEMKTDLDSSTWLSYTPTPRDEPEPGYWLYAGCSGTPAFAVIDARGTLLNAELPEAIAWLNQCQESERVLAAVLARIAGLRLPKGVSDGLRSARIMEPTRVDDRKFYGEPDLATRRAECDAFATACAAFARELERAIVRAGGITARETTLNDETREWLREARDAHVRACEAGFAQSCHAEAALARDALDRDARHIEKFYLRGCDGGYALSCSNLAEIYNRGLSSTVPGVRSVRLAGQPEIRTPTGIDDPKRPAIAKNLARSAEFYQRACDLGDRDGCRLQGMTLQEIASTAAQTRADEIFVRLCHRADWSSCLFLTRTAEAAGGEFAGKSTEYWRARTCLFGGDQYCGP